MTRAQFARRERIRPETLSWWRWKLASEGGGRRRARVQRVRAESELAFVEVASRAASVLGSGETRIELEMGRVTLRVPDRFSPETLARVLKVLAEVRS